jgi:hypothetical protein
MTVIIDHERYGARTEFSSVAEAQTAIRESGPEFAATTLSESHGRVYDQREEIVGTVDTNDLAESVRLIRAAPDLLEACRAGLACLGQYSGTGGVAAILSAAIARAEGRERDAT